MIPYPKETLKKISKTFLKKGIVPAFNAACPHNAIKLKLDNPHAVDDVVNRILAKVDLS